MGENLTPAQKRALEWLHPNRLPFFPVGNEDVLNELCEGDNPLVQKGPLVETMLGGKARRYCLTPAGIALRAEILP